MKLSALLLPDLRRLLREAPERIRELLDDVHPEDFADLVGELDPDDAAELMRLMPAEEAAPIFGRLEEHEQEALAELMPAESMAEIASEMEADERADLFSTLPEAMGDAILAKLQTVDPEAAEEVREMEKWPETSAGHLLTTSYCTARPDVTIAQVLDAVRAHVAEIGDQPVYNVYAMDDQDRLLGFAPLKDLIVAQPSELFDQVYSTNILSVPPDMDQEEVARHMAKYDLNVVPVVGGAGEMLGVITIDDIIDVLTQEQTEDVQRIGGVEPLDVPYFQTSFWSFIKKRGVWLVVLFVEEFFTQTALRHYDPVFEAIRGASYYVPLLISAGGNSGSQSSTLVIRGLAIGEVRMRDWWRILVRETGMGLVLGLGLGLLGFLRVLSYKDQSLSFAFTIALTLVGIVTTGCTVGSMLPLVLKRAGIDPATSSTPFIASLVDVIGIIIFVYCAKLLMAATIAQGAMRAAGVCQ